MLGKTVQEKYETFLENHNEGVRRYVPLYKVKKKIKQIWYNTILSWYNTMYAEAMKKNYAAWRKSRKQKNENNRKQYNEARDKCIKLRREEERKFEQDIASKCGEEPKLFYRYINGKMPTKTPSLS